MNRHGISQEGLKLIACVTMLLDHIGAAFLPWMWLRIIGRLSFPIYCFLLAEGISHTRNPWKYGIRLFVGMLLAEIPFDLLFSGRLDWRSQSVMVTLLLGFLMAIWARKSGNILLPFGLCFFAAELLNSDYGGMGVALVALFVVSDGKPHQFIIRLAGMVILMLLMGSVEVTVGIVSVPIQMFAVLALIPIRFYSGRKVTNQPWIQWGFYLFYPVHLMVLWIVSKM